MYDDDTTEQKDTLPVLDKGSSDQHAGTNDVHDTTEENDKQNKIMLMM